MSSWTYINGIITVSPMGRTQPEKRYILDTALAHLPRVTGSEGDMDVYVIQKDDFDSSCSHDEFGQYSNLGNERGYGHPFFNVQNEYILVVDGSFRDRIFSETMKEFTKWLCRLSKRILVCDVLVRVNGYEESYIFDKYEPYCDMWEKPSWYREKNNKEEYHEPNWCEYLMWDHAKGLEFPMMLEYKYYNNKENDDEVERRMNYTR
jgi:hypothetical protein